jgi:hypothetical protein
MALNVTLPLESARTANAAFALTASRIFWQSAVRFPRASPIAFAPNPLAAQPFTLLRQNLGNIVEGAGVTNPAGTSL